MGGRARATRRQATGSWLLALAEAMMLEVMAARSPPPSLTANGKLVTL